MKIELNEIEQKLCISVAEARYKHNRDKKVKDGKIGPQSVQETDLNGFAAELIMSKILGVYPDLNIKARGVMSDEAGDLQFNEHTLDIKWTKYKTGKLVIHPGKKKNPCDIYVLVVGEFPVYEFKGFVSKDKAFAQDNIKNLGYGLTYAVDQDKLETDLSKL